MADEDVDVVLKDDESKPGETVVETPLPDGGVNDDIAALQKRLDEADARRVAAEQQRDAAMRRVTQAESTAHGSQMAVIQSGLDTIEANASTYEAQMEAALAAGDFKLHTQINRKLVEEAAQKVELLKGKAHLEAQSRQPSAPSPAADPVELYVQNMKPRAASWIRSHADYVTDPRKNQRLLAQHYAALADGHEEGGDSYFSFIENGLNMRGGGGQTQSSAPQPDPTSAAAQVAARRDEVQPSPAPTSRGGSSRTIKLTRSEQEAAEISGQTYEEYARSLEREKKAGTLIYTHNQRRH